MSNILNISASKDIDLLSHGVIEAHAGTGKTFSIVKMVMRMLEEPDPEGKPVHLRQILLVTFTDKAAGELKRRIREGLECRIRELRRNGGGHIPHLEDCLNTMHEAFIGTIHGVCLRLLRTWPFETGIPFRTELADDEEGLEKELRASMRTDWQDPGTGIPWALERLREEGWRLGQKHVGAITAMAGGLLDAEDTELDRRTCFGSIAGLKEAADASRSSSELLKKTLRRLTGAAKKILENPAPLNEKRIAFVAGLARDWESACALPVLPPERVLRASWVRKRGGFKIRPDLVAAEIALSTVVRKNPQVRAFADEFRAFAEDRAWKPVLDLPDIKRKLVPTLLCDAAELLRSRWERAKRETGLISFRDMLRLMHRAVTVNRFFRDSLRGRLRFGIIDEFQDTSTLQWRIFESVFLDGAGDGGPRLFIVGDPKQSIYAFRGADVQSYGDAKAAIEEQGGKVYGLADNYRSLPAIIDGCNTLFGRERDGPDWFAFDGAAQDAPAILYPDSARGGVLAGPPERTARQPSRTGERPVQVMALEGSAGVRRAAMARWTSMVIRSLVRKNIVLPDGAAWTERRLEYRDFAVIVESHAAARPFLDRFKEDGVPAVKYKMEGVFQSSMARGLHAVLRAILHSGGGPAPRRAALLTVFFNRRPCDIDPEKALEFCSEGPGCAGDRLCIAHALEEWTALAERRRWSRMFARIESRTGVRERLIRLADGERHLADLRQVADYCIERLCRDNLTLEQLVEHLGRLLSEEESAGQDRNLYTLATDRSSVRVLTMHAAKGLEFPVVFVVPGSSDKPKSGTAAEAWISRDHKRHVMPPGRYRGGEGVHNDETERVVSWGVGAGGRIEVVSETKPVHSLQATRERRRLLYVALTRAQAMLFVPVQVQEKRADWLSCPLPRRSPDRDLTPRLLHLLAEDRLSLFHPGYWEAEAGEDRAAPARDDHLDPAWVLPADARAAAEGIQRRLAALDLPGAVRIQTSYTSLSVREAGGRSIDKSEKEPPEKAAGRASALPGGSGTGDALHRALEELLSAGREKTEETVRSDDALRALVRRYLDRSGVLGSMDDGEAALAADAAAALVGRACAAPLALPDGGTVTVAALDRNNRVPEMEFTLSAGRHWVRGYMDLVFRVPHPGARQHRWRYYVLDWKSDLLGNYGPEALQACMEERHYDLQAKLYSHALDRFLRGLLRGAYEPAANLGGSVYVFLRGFGEAEGPVWTRAAEPENDAVFTEEKLRGAGAAGEDGTDG